jgi:predicted transcriptional regulator
MKFIKYLKINNISLRELATSCNIPYATLYNNIEKPETIKAGNLKKISSYLEMTMEETFNMMLDKGESLLEVLIDQKCSKLTGSIYHVTQVGFAYNTNRIEGSKLTEDETRYIFETNTLIDKI